jgi:hypothetical protein
MTKSILEKLEEAMRRPVPYEGLTERDPGSRLELPLPLTESHPQPRTDSAWHPTGWDNHAMTAGGKRELATPPSTAPVASTRTSPPKPEPP